MLRATYFVLAATLAATVSAGATFAHSGGTNAQGCHNNRKTGDYHCHGGGGRAAPAPAPRQRPQAFSGGSTYYANCSEARAAGAAPLRRGEPGYRPAMDRDNDGVACE
ncbi:MAG: excalibur calcium-binding domain-containing protein [Caulobacter sp.]|nr:excalibur calcium-binding domain-containing protein [Caulobacter sp.]